MKDPAALPPLLLPRPAQLELREATASGPTPESVSPRVEHDGSLPAGGFRVETRPGAIEMGVRDPAGERQARRVLDQLRAQYRDRIPALSIVDWPGVPTRGLMLDVSRDRVPTMAELGRLVPTLGGLGLNHLQLYTEHTFAYAGHEDVWSGWQPITPAEIEAAQQLCREHGLELAANQNCFGHLERWLSLPRYAPLAETHGDWAFDRFTRSGPFSLCPGDPGSLGLVGDLLGQLLPLIGSPLVNVGCDETYDVGQGRSRERVEMIGKAAVYFEFLENVFEIVRSYGKRPMFWADVALSHPESVGRIPEDSIALAWGYEADTDFDRWCALLGEAGKTAWVCPGTSSWRSITGRTTTRRANLAAAAAAAARHSLGGVLITDWGDSGHHQAWPVALAAIAEGADRAWNAGRAGEPDARAASLHCFGDRSLRVASWLDDLGDIDLHLRERAGRAWFEGRRRPLENATVHAADLAEPWDSDALATTADEFEDLRERLGALRADRPCLDDRLLDEELTLTLDRAEFAVRRGIARRRGHAADSSLLDLAVHVRDEHRRLWPERSRPGLGLEDSSAYDQRAIEELQRS